MIAIKIDQLNKSYDGKKVVDDLSFEIPENSICGFLGPNGAGKTTTFKLITNLINKDSGTIEIFGKEINNTTQIKDIRFLQDVPEFYDFMNAYEYLEFICKLNNLSGIDKKIKDTLKLVGLEDAKKKRIGKYSRGMKQRLGIAASIIPNPKILLLDEPVSALDPLGRKDIFELLNKLKGKMTIIFSSHIIDDIERVSDLIIIINHGKKVLDDKTSKLKTNHLTDIIEIEFKNIKDLNKFKKQLDSKTSEFEIIHNMLRIKFSDSNIQDDIFKVLTSEKINIISFNIVTPSLEDIFVSEVSK